MSVRAAADLRHGQAWSTRQQIKNGVLAALASTLVPALARTPPLALHLFGRAAGVLAPLLLVGPRRLAEANVARVFPEATPSQRRDLVRRCFRSLGSYLGHTAALLSGRGPRLHLEEPSRDLLRAAVAEGRGVVLPSAHLGPWEHVARALKEGGVPLVAVGRESYDPRLQRIYDVLRGGVGIPMLYRGHPGAPRAMVRTLRAGQVLGMPMDLASRVPTVEVPFLGCPTAVPVGPARLALRTGAKVVVATAAPASTTVQSPLDLVVTCTAIPTEGLDEVRLTGAIADALSARILALPHAWPWMHPRWDR